MPRNSAARLAEAHAARDTATIVRIYREAGERHEAAGDIDQACFYLTQAYIWALEAGLAEAGMLHARLVAHGREA